MSEFKVEVKGIEKVEAGLQKFPLEIAKYLHQAGDESAKRVLFKTPGLGGSKAGYPPMTDANRPPVPYYIRGRGTQTASGNKYNSRRLATQWYVRQEGLGTKIGNSTPYGQYVIGEEQAHFMAPIGWRRLVDVVEEKWDQITKVYQARIDKLINDLGL